MFVSLLQQDPIDDDFSPWQLLLHPDQTLQGILGEEDDQGEPGHSENGRGGQLTKSEIISTSFSKTDPNPKWSAPDTKQRDKPVKLAEEGGEVDEEQTEAGSDYILNKNKKNITRIAKAKISYLESQV